MMQEGKWGHSLAVACMSLLVLLGAPALAAQHGGGSHSQASQPRGSAVPPQSGFRGDSRGGSIPGAIPGGGLGASAAMRPHNGQHLPQWFAQHQGLAPNQQEEALRHEPGFARLPQGQQQQLIDRLHRLDLAPPAQRQRMLERNERFEALPPERQQAIRGASQALGQMPQERRQAVHQAFRDLRNLPPEDRQNALNSARFQAEYSPQERTVLSNLLSIEPYQPQQAPQ